MHLHIMFPNLLQISSFRESKSDDRRFYIFTATKTLHLRTNSKKERVAWIQALISTRSLFSSRPQSGNTPLLTRELSVSTERLKQRLLEDGIGEGLVNDCEQIMLSEFSGVQGQFQVLCEERSNLLDTLRQLEVVLPILLINYIKEYQRSMMRLSFYSSCLRTNLQDQLSLIQ